VQPEVKKLLLRECDKQMSASLPAFEVCESEEFAGSGRLFIDRSATPVFFLFFQISDKRDAFTLEMAWSQKGVFPPPADYPVPRDWPDIGVKRADTGVEEFRFRLSKLWVKPKYDPWWEFLPRGGASKSAEMSVVAEQNLSDAEKCEYLVADALKRFNDFGGHYMREVRSRDRSGVT
jgi:hypothetical protein